jgi:hypothetical protein
MGSLGESLKKIGRRGTELLLKYWTELRSKKLLGVPYFVWLILVYYTLKGIAFLFVMWYFLNA